MTDSQGRELVLKALLRLNEWPDFELNECSFTIVSTPVVARTRRLRARWVLEEDQHVEAEFEPGVEERLKEILDNMTR
jgi:hypothetical protein